MEITIPNVAVVIEAKVSSDGRIYGLLKYAGSTVKVAVLEKKKAKK